MTFAKAHHMCTMQLPMTVHNFVKFRVEREKKVKWNIKTVLRSAFLKRELWSKGKLNDYQRRKNHRINISLAASQIWIDLRYTLPAIKEI
jgi:neutral trehalase